MKDNKIVRATIGPTESFWEGSWRTPIKSEEMFILFKTRPIRACQTPHMGVFGE